MSLTVLQVVYTRGPLLWQGFTVLGNSVFKRKLAPRSNAPSQEYNPADRSVINRASILGSVAVEASGRYTPVVASMQQYIVKVTRLWHRCQLSASCCISFSALCDGQHDTKAEQRVGRTFQGASIATSHDF